MFDRSIELLFSEPSERSKRLLLTQCLSKVAPDSYPLSDDPQKVDYVTLTFEDDDSANFFWIKRLDGKNVEGLQWNGESFAFPISIQLAQITGKNLNFHFAYGETRLVGTGWAHLRYALLTNLPHRARTKSRITRWFLHKTTRFHSSKYDLLKALVNLVMNRNSRINFSRNPMTGRSAYALLREIYDFPVHNVSVPPGRMKEFNALLDCLVDAGALVCANGKYAITHRAISLLADYEVAERRHQGSVRTTWALVFMTFVLAAIGAIDLTQR